MESNSNQYCSTPQLLLILHPICQFCISWWDCVCWMFWQVYLDFTALVIMVHSDHLTARSCNAPWASSYDSDDTPERSISSWSWCLVSSSYHTGLSYEPHQRAGGDCSLCYYNHWVRYSTAMCVVLRFAPVGQPVEMPGTGYSIPRACELLPHGLLQWHWGLSHPH